MDHALIASIDIGGSKIAVGVGKPRDVLSDGRLTASMREPIPGEGKPPEVIDRAVERIQELSSASGQPLAAIGISIGGPLDHRAGFVSNFPHLPGWIDIPLRAIVQERLGVPAFLDNDANLGALAEHRVGAGRGVQDMVYVTISSGIGGGVIVGSELLHGVGTGAGEVGHITVDRLGPPCSCGNRGCLEALASGRSIARRARELVAFDPRAGAPLLAVAGGNLSAISSEMVADLARNGDPLAVALWEETAEFLAIGLGSIIHVLAPEVIVLGGGVAQTGELLLGPVLRRLQNHVFYVQLNRIRLVSAAIGGESPLVGAAILACERMRES